MHENVRLFAPVIHDAGANMALYLTWARRNNPNAQATITAAYESIAGEMGARVAPVGVAWERFLAGQGEPALHDKDDSHPTLAGSYLAACVFLAVLFGESPVGIEPGPEGLNAEEAQLLQGAAADVVRAR